MVHMVHMVQGAWCLVHMVHMVHGAYGAHGARCMVPGAHGAHGAWCGITLADAQQFISAIRVAVLSVAPQLGESSHFPLVNTIQTFLFSLSA
jgi:hypothetical protein